VLVYKEIKTLSAVSFTNSGLLVIADMASNTNTNKRRRTAADTLHISDLPAGFIADVSEYLPKPSRAILAVAFTSSSLWQNDNLMHRLSPISKAIISASQWDILDFEDVEKELAKKLIDYHLDAILKSINAHDVLKKIKLCGCVNITGIGLHPLQGSIVLEQIDLSLVGKYETPIVKAKISQEVVVPILDSIISSDGCSLKHIMFPRHLRGKNARSVSLNQFRERYDMFYDSRGLSCSNCNAEISDIVWMRTFQNNVCYDCLKPFCSDCTDENGETLNYCVLCEKDFCVECVSRTECCTGDCGNNTCSGCAERSQCQQCNATKCGDCLYTCDECKRTRCKGCVSYHHEGKKSYCADCYHAKPSLLLGYRAPC